MYDPVDERGVPQSRGIPKAVQIAVMIGIIAIFAVGWWTLRYAGYGHNWPWQKSLRITLNGNYNP